MHTRERSPVPDKGLDLEMLVLLKGNITLKWPQRNVHTTNSILSAQFNSIK